MRRFRSSTSWRFAVLTFWRFDFLAFLTFVVMHPELITLPILGISIKTYGFFMMVGFLSAVWLAMRRAGRVKADPDTVLDMSFLALLFGVGGARIFYVVHYWQSQFANAPNKILAVVDITKGGLEFLGGFLGAMIAIAVYSARKKVSLRLYLDILAPATMWGLAFGRLGCFFNGCCFGGPGLIPPTDSTVEPPAHEYYSWAVEFPFGSPAQWQQWEDRKVTVPAELIVTADNLARIQPWLVSAPLLSMPVEQRKAPGRRLQDARRAYEEARAAAPDTEETAKLKAALDNAVERRKAHTLKLAVLLRAQRFPSRIAPQRATSVSELEALASTCRSLPVHPTQLYSAINALLLSGVLAALFYVRKRHGVVIAALFVLYPIPRVLLELIRIDNPHDVGGLTISQFVSLGMLIAGIAALFILYKRMPERSPALNIEMSRRHEV